MRIGIVCPYDWTAPGGVQVHVRDLADELLDMGHEVSVLAPSDEETELEPYVVSAGRPVPVPYNGSVARVNIGPVSAARVRRWIRDGNFDVVHVHEPTSPSLSMLACWVADGPLVATCHSSVAKSRAMSAAYFILQTAVEKIDARIAVSEKARQTVVEHLGGDAVLIPNGVACKNIAEGDPLPGYPRPGGTLMFLGRIDEDRKGLDILLRAMPEIVAARPDVRLLVAGPGDIAYSEKHLSPQIKQNVEFMGLISEADKISLFKSVDAYIAPNTGGESFGIVLLEAMSSGCPVVASDIDAFARVLEDGRCGVLFQNMNAQDLATKTLELLDDRDRQERLAEEGLRRALMFDWSTVARDVVRVYESVTVGGEKVEADLSGQALGRLGRIGEE